MNVCAKPDVVCQIPSDVVRVVINDDLVGIPKPSIAKCVIVRSNAEVETAKPETVSAATLEVKDMAAADAAGEVSVFPRMIEMIVRIVAAGIMSNPLIISMHVRSIGMARFIAEITLGRGLPRRFLHMSLGARRRTVRRRRPMRGNMATTYGPTVSATPLLRKKRKAP